MKNTTITPKKNPNIVPINNPNIKIAITITN